MSESDYLPTKKPAPLSLPPLTPPPPRPPSLAAMVATLARLPLRERIAKAGKIRGWALGFDRLAEREDPGLRGIGDQLRAVADRIERGGAA